MKVKKSLMIYSLLVIVILLVTIVVILFNDNPGISESQIKCIAANSHLYVQTGCSHCEDQKAMFGKSYNLINSTDCAFYPNECAEAGITATPTWVIDGNKILGVQSIDKLLQYTGCD